MLALLLQIAASFGHLHARDFAGAIAASKAADWHNATPAKTFVSNPGALTDDDDQCPICFSDFLLAASSVPDVEQPVAHIGLRDVDYVATRIAFLLPVSGKAFFQSRAPPAA